MSNQPIHTVTGAFGYSGKYIAQCLLDKGHKVQTITNSVNRQNPFGEKITIAAYNFDNSVKLTQSLQGTAVLYNTYWVRFNHKTFTFTNAVNNTRTLINCAKKAGVRRFVHISITNPSVESKLEYFKGKAILEKALIESGLSYSILRPAVLFGKEDILINNIAWALRRFPIFGVFGDGSYRLQPIFIGDLAELAVEQGDSRENNIINAIGPETFTYRELAHEIGKGIGKRRPIISIPPSLGYWTARIIGWIVRDVFVTRDEIKGLMDGTLVVDTPPVGKTHLTTWIQAHADSLGRKYTSELARRKDRVSVYKSN
jgi:NADH dehydrogenase